MKKLRIGLVGAGNIANVHLNAYKKHDNAEIAAICDINEKALNKTADKYDIKERYTSIDEMLEKAELDAVDVCVWNNAHSECAIKALNKGLDVMCEKPMAISLAEAEKMYKAAKENNRLLMIGFVMRFGDGARVAKDFIDNGYMGDIYYSKATYLRRHGNPGGWFADVTRSGGGPVIDLGVHVIDYTRYLMGLPKPVSVYAATFDKLSDRKNLKTLPGWVPEDRDPDAKCTVEDMATALIRYDNGAVTLLETSYSLNCEPRTDIEIFGDKGGFKVEGDNMKIYTEINDYLADVTPQLADLKDSADMFQAETAHFIDCALNKKKCIATAEDGLTVMKILDAIYKSAKTGHEVLIED